MVALLLAVGVEPPLAAQNPPTATGPIARAEALLRGGRIEEAELLLNRHVASQPNDGKAWLFLGRIYLGAAHDWHTTGHPGASGPILLDFATQTIEQAHQLLTDSGNVFRVVVEVERATNRIEELGWARGVAVAISAEDLPLPPVLREFGRNLIASCPDRGVLVTGGLVETTAAWGSRLLAPPMSVSQLARTGLGGSVWGAPTRDLYNLAALRNRGLCTSLFVKPDAQGLPAIPACLP